MGVTYGSFETAIYVQHVQTDVTVWYAIDRRQARIEQVETAGGEDVLWMLQAGEVSSLEARALEASGA